MDVDSAPGGLKRCNSAPVINADPNPGAAASDAGTNSTNSAVVRSARDPVGFNVFASASRTRRFSASSSSSPPNAAAPGAPTTPSTTTLRLAPRVDQLKNEDHLFAREVTHEREVHSAMQISQSYEDLTLETEGLFRSANLSSQSPSPGSANVTAAPHKRNAGNPNATSPLHKWNTAAGGGGATSPSPHKWSANAAPPLHKWNGPEFGGNNDSPPSTGCPSTFADARTRSRAPAEAETCDLSEAPSDDNRGVGRRNGVVEKSRNIEDSSGAPPAGGPVTSDHRTDGIANAATTDSSEENSVKNTNLGRMTSNFGQIMTSNPTNHMTSNFAADPTNLALNFYTRPSSATHYCWKASSNSASGSGSSPSPTRKSFATRRSLSPTLMRPSQLTGGGISLGGGLSLKRKFLDMCEDGAGNIVNGNCGSGLLAQNGSGVVGGGDCKRMHLMTMTSSSSPCSSPMLQRFRQVYQPGGAGTCSGGVCISDVTMSSSAVADGSGRVIGDVTMSNSGNGGTGGVDTAGINRSVDGGDVTMDGGISTGGVNTAGINRSVDGGDVTMGDSGSGSGVSNATAGSSNSGVKDTGVDNGGAGVNGGGDVTMGNVSSVGSGVNNQ